MTGCADADQRFAAVHEFADYVHLLCRQSAAAHADEREVGLVEYIESRQIVGIGFAAVYGADAEILTQVFQGERRQRLLRLIFRLGHNQDQVRPFIAGETEQFAAEELVTGNGGTYPFLDMFDDQIGAGEMADERRGGRYCRQ